MTTKYATLLMTLQAKSLRIMREERSLLCTSTQEQANARLRRIAVHAHRIQRINQKMKQTQ